VGLAGGTGKSTCENTDARLANGSGRKTDSRRNGVLLGTGFGEFLHSRGIPFDDSFFGVTGWAAQVEGISGAYISMVTLAVYRLLCGYPRCRPLPTGSHQNLLIDRFSGRIAYWVSAKLSGECRAGVRVRGLRDEQWFSFSEAPLLAWWLICRVDLPKVAVIG